MGLPDAVCAARRSAHAAGLVGAEEPQRRAADGRPANAAIRLSVAAGAVTRSS